MHNTSSRHGNETGKWPGNETDKCIEMCRGGFMGAKGASAPFKNFYLAS